MQEFTVRLEPLRGRLFRTALAILGSPSAAEEALDEAAFRGLGSCGRLREPEYFSSTGRMYSAKNRSTCSGQQPM